MLPNLGALARGDAAATGGPVSQGSQPPPASQAPRPNDGAEPPHEVHLIEGVVRAVLAQLGDADDPEAACALVKSFCDTDTFHKWACYPGDPTDPQNPWRVITKRVFKSTDVDRALFAHDELLETDPKRAFKRACFDRAAARVVGLKFLTHALDGVKKRAYGDWGRNATDDDLSRSEMHETEGWSAVDVMHDFEQDFPITVKFNEWKLLARQKYKKSDDKFKIFDVRAIGTERTDATLTAAKFGVEGTEEWPQVAWHRAGWEMLKDMTLWTRNPTNWLAEEEPWKEFWERADESVHALAERVGRATVWVWRKADGGHIEIADEHTNIAEACVRAFPLMEFSNK
jgi:hypothetical protein